MSLADVVHEAQRPAAISYSAETQDLLRAQLEELSAEATLELQDQGFTMEHITYDSYLNMRYAGSSSSLMVLKGSSWNFKSAFEERHKREFGFLFEDKPIIVDDIRVRAIGAAHAKSEKSPYVQLQAVQHLQTPSPSSNGSNKVYFTGIGLIDTPVFELSSLALGSKIVGPALIIDKTQTIVVVPGAVANILETCVVVDLPQKPANDSNQSSGSENHDFSPIQLSIFGHRFMSIAEQMGRTLQKTSVSTNIKERLDFSCALFSPDGGLVANAPHVPVHLGSMQFAVRYQHKLWEGKLQDGDVLVSNHPSCGGTHLPGKRFSSSRAL